jgi:hypothetical protein
VENELGLEIFTQLAGTENQPRPYL